MCAGSGRARYQQPHSPAVGASNSASEALPSAPVREAGPSSRPTETAATTHQTAAVRVACKRISPAGFFW